MERNKKDEGNVKEKLLELAKQNGLEPTEHFEKLLKAKERGNLGFRCPCDPNNPDRFCISPLCLSDIETKGACHCNCWRKQHGM